MLKYKWNANKEAIPGNPRPQLAVDLTNKAWFMWTNLLNKRGVPVQEQQDSSSQETEIIIAQLNKGIIENKVNYKISSDSVKARALCVVSNRPIAFWTQVIGGINCLVVGSAGAEPYIIPIDASVWDTKAVKLLDESILLGVITLRGKKSVLQFFRFDPVTKELNKYENLQIDDVWSLSMTTDENSGRVWIAFEKYDSDRFAVAGGFCDFRENASRFFVLPSEGYATEPTITLLNDGRACVVWRQEKDWGKQVYDFMRDTQLKIAFIDEDGVKASELIPVPLPEEVDKQKLPASPVAVQHGDHIRVFFRYFRTEIDRREAEDWGLMVNDWGYQLYEMVRDADGNWYQPAIVSLDVSYPDESVQAALVDEGLVLIYHSCSFDSQREYIHSERINIAISRGIRSMLLQESIAEKKFKIYSRPVLYKRPMEAINGRELNCYWGDIHRHSVVSKCIPEHDGSYADHIKYAVAARKFDFYSIIDHDDQITAREWKDYLSFMDSVNQDGKFVTLYGFEGPLASVRGHLNFYFLDRESALYGFYQIREMKTFKEICANLRSAGFTDRIYSIRHFHADKLPYKDIFDSETALFDPEFDVAMEVVQGRGYAPKTIKELLSRGFKFAFVGGSDHNRPPGHPKGGVGIYEQALTGLWAPDLSRKSVFAGLKERSTFSTNGARLAVLLKVNGTFMGKTAVNHPKNKIEVKVYPTTEVNEVRLIRDGEVVAVCDERTSEPKVYEFEDQAETCRYYFVEVIQESEGELNYPGIAWTTPVWIKA
ncbi:MAG TPA: CehA/McbA family metallohydrolase [Firmicutes bacterium]|nr:CehA/McbA family metallohydrolase [Bacillota bacterium]